MVYLFRVYLAKAMFYGFDLLKGFRITSLVKRLERGEIIHPSHEVKSSVYPIASHKHEVNKLIAEGTNIGNPAMWVYSSGSTGTPVKLPLCAFRARLRTASAVYYNQKAGYQIGHPILIVKAKKRGRLSQFLRNEDVFIPSDLSDKSIGPALDLLYRRKTQLLIGYPSVIAEFARYMIDNNLEAPSFVKGIVLVSEKVEELQVDIIYKAFQVIPKNRYASEEVGVVAQSIDTPSKLKINQQTLRVELIHSSGRRAVEGECGEVLVTDLLNSCVPLSGYSLGDIACYDQTDSSYLSSVNGRVGDVIYTVDGTPVNSISLGPCIYKPLSNAHFFSQYQFAQTGRHSYEVRIDSERKPDEVIIDEICRKLKSILGSEAVVTFVSGFNLQRLGSGKLRVYINESSDVDIQK